MKQLYSDWSVLVAEDIEKVAETYRGYLEELGVEEPEIYSGEMAGVEALEKVRKDHDEIDLLVLDRQMPYVSGDAIAEEVREEGWDMNILIASGEEAGKKEARNLPFDRYLKKPFGPQEFCSEIIGIRLFSEYDEVLDKMYSLSQRLAMLDSEDYEGEKQQLQGLINQIGRDSREIVQEITEETGRKEKEVWDKMFTLLGSEA